MLVREFLSSIRAGIELAARDLTHAHMLAIDAPFARAVAHAKVGAPSISPTMMSDSDWADCTHAIDDIQDEIYEASDEGSVVAESFDNEDAPGVRVVDVVWQNGMRRGGDAEYDGGRDGNIVLQGACFVEDPVRNASPQPIWSADRARVQPSDLMATPRWSQTPSTELLTAIASHVAALGTVTTNSWTVSPPNVATSCHELFAGTPVHSTLKEVLSFRTRCALVRVRDVMHVASQLSHHESGSGSGSGSRSGSGSEMDVGDYPTDN